jgi:hypothetical protein
MVLTSLEQWLGYHADQSELRLNTDAANKIRKKSGMEIPNLELASVSKKTHSTTTMDSSNDLGSPTLGGMVESFTAKKDIFSLAKDGQEVMKRCEALLAECVADPKDGGGFQQDKNSSSVSLSWFSTCASVVTNAQKGTKSTVGADSLAERHQDNLAHPQSINNATTVADLEDDNLPDDSAQCQRFEVLQITNRGGESAHRSIRPSNRIKLQNFQCLW